MNKDEAAREGRPDTNMITGPKFSKPHGGALIETRLQIALTRLRELIASSLETLERDERGVFLSIVATRVAKEIAERTRWSR